MSQTKHLPTVEALAGGASATPLNFCCFPSSAMPEFENLEPFLHRDGNHIMPVAPHSVPAQDYVPRRRDPRPQRQTNRKQSPTLIEPLPVEGAKRLTTQEMEKAYRAAMKESRARDKSKARKQGKTPWNRFKKWVSKLFSPSRPTTRQASGKPNSRNGKPPRRHDGASKGPRRRTEDTAKAGGGERSSEDSRRQRPPRQRSRKKPRERQPDDGNPRAGRDNRPKKDGPKSSPQAGNRPPSGERRPRRRRNKRPNKGGDGSSSPRNQPSAE